MMDWKQMQLDLRRFLISQMPTDDQPEALRLLEREIRNQRRLEYRRNVHLGATFLLFVVGCLFWELAVVLFRVPDPVSGPALVTGLYLTLTRVITLACGWGLWLPRRITARWEAEDALEALSDDDA